MIKQPAKLSFAQTLKKARSNMSKTEKIFSHIIHNQAVDTVSQILSRTVMRPIPIIVGAASALILGSTIYIISIIMDYGWSGSEIILLFALGWAAGMAYDYIILLIKGRT
jgi:hypothetical protein